MEYIASISYGKDSLAMLEVIRQNSLPLDRIVHVEVMAKDKIPADLPPMMEFKGKADEIILKKYGIVVEHLTAPKTYEDYFYKINCGTASKNRGKIYGFPLQKGNWCNSRLKVGILNKLQKHAVMYIRIAADEPHRFHTLSDIKRSPLVEYGWTEAMCRKWCEENGLLSPIYESLERGGCWFCHNQGVAELRRLRKNYPKYWELMLKWDKDSPATFKAGGKTIHDFDKRFEMEEKGLITAGIPFRWKMIENK